MRLAKNHTTIGARVADAIAFRGPARTRWRRARAMLIGAVLAQASLVAAAGGNFPSGSNAITVKPGDTGTCALSPCRITLEMPPGNGSYEVTANEISIGSFPAGKTVNLGNYFDSQALVIKGAGVRKTYVYILKGL